MRGFFGASGHGPLRFVYEVKQQGEQAAKQSKISTLEKFYVPA